MKKWKAEFGFSFFYKLKKLLQREENMEKIEIEYYADIKNYFEAAKYFTKSKIKRNIFDKIMEIFVLLIGGFMLITGKFLIGIIFLIFGLLFMLGILEKAVTYMYFKMYIAKIGCQKLLISEDKIKYERKDINSDIDWNYYKGFMETPSTILLLYGKKYYSVIPKDAFSGNELENFILLLCEKFPENKYKLHKKKHK